MGFTEATALLFCVRLLITKERTAPPQQIKPCKDWYRNLWPQTFTL